MADNRNCGCGSGNKDTAYIDTNKILDSCRDKECFEDVPVYLTDYGKDIIEHSTNVRTCSAKIVATNINVNPIAFNRGFYQVDIRIFVKLTFEVCVCHTNRQIIEGIAVVDKKAVLFGSESNVSTFRSDPNVDNFCSCPTPNLDTGCVSNLPTAVFEVADPVVLSTRIVEKTHPCHCCCCCAAEIPEPIRQKLNGMVVDPDEKRLVVSLGFFSVTRLERPAQFLINATEYCVPNKECCSIEGDDPCCVFRQMEFPYNEFCSPAPSTGSGSIGNGCGCKDK